MRINKTKAASSAPETSEIRSLIMNEFAQWHAKDGALETAIPGVILYRYSAPTEPASLFFEPRISVALQGTKRVVLGDEEYVYGESQFILTAVDVPVVAQVVEATREKPYLCVLLKLDLEIARQMISDFEVPVTGSILPRYGLSTGPATHELLDAIYRLLRLLSTPSDIPIPKASSPSRSQTIDAGWSLRCRRRRFRGGIRKPITVYSRIPKTFRRTAHAQHQID